MKPKREEKGPPFPNAPRPRSNLSSSCHPCGDVCDCNIRNTSRLALFLFCRPPCDSFSEAIHLFASSRRPLDWRCSRAAGRPATPRPRTRCYRLSGDWRLVLRFVRILQMFRVSHFAPRPRIRAGRRVSAPDGRPCHICRGLSRSYLQIPYIWRPVHLQPPQSQTRLSWQPDPCEVPCVSMFSGNLNCDTEVHQI